MTLTEKDFSVNLAGIQLEHPMMNAAGTCRTLEEVEELARSASSAIVVGSITYEARDGNSGETYWSGPGYSLNNRGLPNLGITYYQERLSQMVEISHKANKPFFLSIAPKGKDYLHELPELLIMANMAGVDLVELNLSCPNLWTTNNFSRIFCFDLDSCYVLFRRINSLRSYYGLKNLKTAVKLSPFTNPDELAKMATMISSYDYIQAITTTNSFPNALVLNEQGKPQLSPDNGLGGLAGSALKPIGLGQVCQLRKLLPENIDIIGVGGIQNCKDVLDYLRVGAKAVQVATAFLDKGIKIFDQLLSELVSEFEKIRVNDNS